jgi:hypothetical protein
MQNMVNTSSWASAKNVPAHRVEIRLQQTFARNDLVHGRQCCHQLADAKCSTAASETGQIVSCWHCLQRTEPMFSQYCDDSLGSVAELHVILQPIYSHYTGDTP